MKRHIQKTGVRRFFGQDLVELQAEPLAVLDGFFAEYGPCVIEGCAITPADGGTFDVAPGLVALESTDPDSGVVAVRTMPFAGAEGVAMPLYLAAEWVVNERVYDDGKVKPIAYHLSAIASGVAPSEPHLVLSATGGNRFVDAVQDPAHRFVTDTERSKWNDILRQAKEYAGLQAEAAQSTAVGLAKVHTDGQVAAVRNELTLGDEQALRSAKEYADRIVAALVDNSPEMLNTLEELAAALGGDPEFATTVMTEIGKRATTTEVNTALAGKANAAHTHNAIPYGALFSYLLNESFGSVSGGKTHSGSLAENDLSVVGNNRVVLSSPNGAWLFEGGQLKRIETVGHTHDSIPTGATFSDLKNDNFGSIASGRYHTGALAVEDIAVEGKNRVVLIAPNGACVYQGGGLYPIYHSGNLKIIRGSVYGNGSYEGTGFDRSEFSGNYVRVHHYIGNTRYSATASVYSSNPGLSDNVVSVAAKYNNYVDFAITNTQGGGVEFAPFDFIIIPW